VVPRDDDRSGAEKSAAIDEPDVAVASGPRALGAGLEARLNGRRSGFTRRLLAAVCLTFLSATADADDPTGPAAADDQRILHRMLPMGDADRKARAAALDALVALQDTRLAPFLESYRIGSIYRWNERLVLCEEAIEDDDAERRAPLSDPLTRQPILDGGRQVIVPFDDIRSVRPDRRERRKVRRAIYMLELWSPDPQKQLAAAKKFGDLRQVNAVGALEKVAADASVDDKVRSTAKESVLLIQLSTANWDSNQADVIGAVIELGRMRSVRALPLLSEQMNQLDAATGEGQTIDQATIDATARSIAQIETHQRFVQLAGYAFQGLSLGSVLVLMALGLAVSFGVMKVINMAHGEMMMVGAVTTWAVHEFIGPLLPEHLHNWYYVAAFPLSFLTAAATGLIVEALVVRHLYRRPLDSLLATIGVSFVLIQTVRWWKGDNLGMSSPTWFTGGVEIVQDLILPYNRMFIIGLTTACVLLTAAMFRYTRFGLLIRATMQNRSMAMSLGVNTRLVDMCTFAYGAGLAGIAGFAIVLLSNPTPEMGQEYIVKSFLVVVSGGVGNLFGVIVSGLGLGFLEKVIEPIDVSFLPIQVFDATWAQVAVLLLVVLFMQRRPSGLFPDRGRLADQPDRTDAPWLTGAPMNRRREAVMGASLVCMGLVVIPAMYITGMMSPIMLNKLGLFVTFAIVAVGLDLIWGTMGVLSLCQFLFFALGAYCMGLYLANHGPKDEFGIPTCLSYVMSDVTDKQPPWFLGMFRTFPAAVLLGLAVPGAVAFVIGVTTFASRVRGVYFAILTQAMTVAFWLIFMKNDLKLGGTNGLTNFTEVLGFAIADRRFPARETFASYGAFRSAYAATAVVQTRFWLYLASVVSLIMVFAATRHLVHIGFGRVLVAIRDDETRLRFCGYKTWIYKTAAFTIAGAFAGLGGMLYAPQKGIITPHQMTAVASIMVVVWVAFGGRGTLWGAIIGALAVSLLYDRMTSFAPQVWKFALGGLFILVPLALPGGLMSLPQVARRWTRSRRTSPTARGMPTSEKIA
jgi:urea transport system permease protein